MTRFNLSEWAVNNRSIVVFLMLLCVIGGIGAYERLGRQEDPDFSVSFRSPGRAPPRSTPSSR